LTFFALPVFYAVTSEGLVETRVTLLRRLHDRRRQGSSRARGPTEPTSA
jgi:hypothetical protein